jgi:glycosyltransferase involved in cell wall biosynthesis
MRIGILTQYYPPEMGAPQARLSHLAGQLARRGHEVTVLTAMPNYPTGRIFPGYGGLWRREARDGVSIIRCGIHPTQSVSLRARLASYFSFVLSSLTVGAFVLPKLDYLMTESPPLFLGISGYLLSLRTGAKWIFNVSDLWPESAVALGAVSQGWGLRRALALEEFCYRKAWLVTGQSREILQNIQSRFPSVRVYHLSNGVDTELFRPELRSAAARARLENGFAGGDSCIAVYAGLHGIAQGLDQVLEAAARLKDLESVSVVLIGDGPVKSELLARSRALGLTHVRFLDPLPKEEMPGLVASADIALVPLKVSLPGAVPSKIYEAMGAGVPVVLVAGGEAAEIVRRSESGVVVPPGDVDGLAAAIRALSLDPARRARLGASGRRAAERDFDRIGIAGRFIDHLEGAAA